MKTGTPARLDGRSLNYAAMEEQPGDENPDKFSYTDISPVQNQLPCYITYTNERVHEVLKTGFEKSPMFNGRIQGLGPRYCPQASRIKSTALPDKTEHQLFVEPEGRSTVEIYVNGFSSSLPEDVQYKALQLIPDLSKRKCSVRDMRSSTIIFHPYNCSIHWKPNWWKTCISPGK